MGVTLHFRGNLKSPDLVPDIVAEIADICDTNDWKYELFDEDRFYQKQPSMSDLQEQIEEILDEDADPALIKTRKLPDIGLRGIMFNPHPECEPIGILFTEKGVLSSIFNALFPEVQGKKRLPWSFAKTQFAGVEIHIQLVNLLDYLGKKYFKKFELKDDGGYYPKKDKGKLEERMDIINHAIGTIEDIFENSNFDGSPEEVIDQIQDAISRSLKGVDIRVIKMNNEDLDELDAEQPEEKKERPKRKRRKKDDNNEELL
jgi:hypothetical protein